MKTIERPRASEVGTNRRKHPRTRLSPMYTSVIVEPKGSSQPSLLGHAYDVSESGIRIELDEPLPVGQSVKLHLDLAGASDSEILAGADVIWVHDENDDPGPRRMALRFTDFRSPDDYLRLSRFLDESPLRMAA